GGWEATVGNTKDILIRTSTGKFIHVNHATTGSTPALYFDEDAGSTFERIQGVVVDNGNEPYKLFVTDQGGAVEGAGFTVQAGLRMATLATTGPKPFTYLVGSTGNEITIESRPDAASIPGAMLVFVQAADAGLNSANFGGEDLFVVDSGGELTKIAYAASPAGVQVYGFPEGATGDLRLQGVIVDDGDETFTTEAATGWVRDTPVGTINATTAAAGSEVAADVDVGVVDFYAIGR
ncbi:hypothetical protein LCGC14_2035090, partial [marine sediment metagenome]